MSVCKLVTKIGQVDVRYKVKSANDKAAAIQNVSCRPESKPTRLSKISRSERFGSTSNRFACHPSKSFQHKQICTIIWNGANSRFGIAK